MKATHLLHRNAATAHSHHLSPRPHCVQARAHPHASSALSQEARKIGTIFELPSAPQQWDVPCFQRIYRVAKGEARARVGQELSTKYAMSPDNSQTILSVTNVWTYEQTHFNAERSRKPQTFSMSAQLVDPTGGGGPDKCDFCNPQLLTAQDTFGRIERRHAISGSNLFKYGEPFHGLALFKHHDPLHWSLEQLQDLLAVSSKWFLAAQRTHRQGLNTDGTSTSEAPHYDEAGGPWGPRKGQHLHTFFLWNCLARSGASQFHGHAQLMATRIPVPSQALMDAQSRAYSERYPGHDYARDMLQAHREVGLLRACAASPKDAQALVDGNGSSRTSRAWVAACLTPIKDMEILVAIEAPASGLKDQANVDGQGLSSPAFARGVHAALRAIIDGFGINSFNVGVLNMPLSPRSSDSSGPSSSMLLARVVSRGHSSKAASDFGCLEVIGGASIGNTDPYLMIAKVDEQLGASSIPLERVSLD